MSNTGANSFARRLHPVNARATPPAKGEYVAYRGLFYPVSAKTGYPLQVVADAAAKQLNKVVIVPGQDHIYTFLSGASRQIRTDGRFEDLNEQERDAFSSSLLRLTLMSDHHDVVVVGDMPGLKGAFQFETVQLEGLVLPPVIKPVRSWLMLGCAAVVILMSFGVSAYINAQSQKQSAAIAEQLAGAETELAAVFAEVKAGREKLSAAQAAPAASGAGTEQLPTVSQSFVTELRTAKRPVTNVTRVENGILQY